MAAVQFLYCFAELNEIRLPCTEITLLASLGLEASIRPQSQDNSASAASLVELRPCRPPNILSLVKTWLHDEGRQIDVLELSRDLLILTQNYSFAIWDSIFELMISQSLHRTFLQTCVLASKLVIFEELLFSRRGNYIVQAILDSLRVSNDKVQPVSLQFINFQSLSQIHHIIHHFFPKIFFDIVDIDFVPCGEKDK